MTLLRTRRLPPTCHGEERCLQNCREAPQTGNLADVSRKNLPGTRYTPAPGVSIAPVRQLAERGDSFSPGCGFDSHRGHWVGGARHPFVVIRYIRHQQSPTLNAAVFQLVRMCPCTGRGAGSSPVGRFDLGGEGGSNVIR